MGSYTANFRSNFCEYQDGKREKMFFLDWMFTKLQPFSNFNHSCPYVGPFYMKPDNLSIDIFAFNESYMPSGRYRVEVSVTENDRILFLELVMFGSISDHRLQKV